MIARDGRCVSLWQDTANPFPAVTGKFVNAVFDVAIVGGGITGITLGLLLQKQGKKCIILEAKNLCFGTTGGTTAHLNTLLDNPYASIIKDFGKEGAETVARATKEALGLFESNVTEFNIDCGFERVPAFLFSQDDQQTNELNDIHDSCNEVGVEARYANGIPIPFNFRKALEIAGQGKIHPVRYVHALA